MTQPRNSIFHNSSGFKSPPSTVKCGAGSGNDFRFPKRWLRRKTTNRRTGARVRWPMPSGPNRGEMYGTVSISNEITGRIYKSLWTQAPATKDQRNKSPAGENRGAFLRPGLSGSAAGRPIKPLDFASGLMFWQARRRSGCLHVAGARGPHCRR